MKVICIGSSAKDIFFPTDGGIVFDTPEDVLAQRKIAFELGAKYQAENRYEALGGCAANVASGLAKLGLPAACYSKVGDDPLGDWIVKELRMRNVLIDCMQVEPGIASDLSAIIVDKKSGERVIFFNRDANEKLKVSPENLGEADWLFVSALNGNNEESWEDNLDKIILLSEGKAKLAYNPGPENIKKNPQKIIEAVKKSEVLIVNKDEAMEIISSGKKNEIRENLVSEEYLIKELHGAGAKIVVLTDGKRGAWAFSGKELLRSPATGNDPVETTGAGDAFTSGFLAATVKGKSVEEALKWGIANSGNSVKFYGAIEGLLTEEQIFEKVKDINVNIISI